MPAVIRKALKNGLLERQGKGGRNTKLNACVNGAGKALKLTLAPGNRHDVLFAVEDIVGLYLSPPEHGVVLSCDEKSQIEALDRTQPGLPLKKGRCETMTHDYKQRNHIALRRA